MTNPAYKRIQDALTAAIDTGNLEEAKVVLDEAEELFDDGVLNDDELAELTFDYIQFEDTQTPTEYVEA